MKKVWIWAITMGLISAIFGVQLGLIPGLILSWIISSIVDKGDEKKKEQKDLSNKIKCPKCQSMNDANAEHCANCGASLKENIIDVEAKPVSKENKDIVKAEQSIPVEIESIKPDNDKNVNDKIKFCRNCGATLKEGAEFCHNCGFKL